MRRFPFFSLLTSSIIISTLLPKFLYALPSEEKIIHGDASFQKTEHSLTITSISPKSILEWQNFSIAQEEHVHFQQPSNASASLNRVTGNNLSEIYGRLTSNGSIYIINPSGILIGKSGLIETKGFVATTLNVDNQEFLQGDPLHISGPSDKLLKNEGSVEALDGNIVFVAKEVSNDGRLKASHGTVSLIGSTCAVLFLQDKNNPAITIKKESPLELEKKANANETTSEGNVETTGLIEAAQIELKAAGGNLYALAVNQSGIIQATGFEEKEGKILLYADVGITKVSGTLKAIKSESESGTFAGEIQVLGDYVHIQEGTNLISSGSLGGGKILIGGDFQGKNPDMKNAKTTFVEKGSLIDVSSFKGEAGKVILWSNEATSFQGEILAASVFGNGGFVEISSKGSLYVPGFVDTRSAYALTGILLLDPTDIEIAGSDSGGGWSYNPTLNLETFSGGSDDSATIDVATLVGYLNSANVIIDATVGSGSGLGAITVTNDIIWNFPNYLYLKAVGGIYVNANITSQYLGPPSPNNPIIKLEVLTSGLGTQAISVTSATISSASGDISLTAENHNQGIIVTNGTISSSAEGNITLTGTGSSSANHAYGIFLQSNSAISTSGSGNITLVGTGGNPSSPDNVGIEIMTSSVNTAEGYIHVTARGGSGSSSYGFHLDQSSLYTQNSGEIIIDSRGSTSSVGNKNLRYGFYIEAGGYISSVDGNILITAIGGGDTSASAAGNMGLFLETLAPGLDTYIKSTGSGTITIEATGGNGAASNNKGINLSETDSDCYISTNSGKIQIDAFGGSQGISASNAIQLRSTGTGNSYIASTSGNIDITATAQSNGKGLVVAKNSYIKTAGIIFIEATAAGTGVFGVELTEDFSSGPQPKIETTSTGTITIDAIGGSGALDYGFMGTLAGTIVRSNSGNISITGRASIAEGLHTEIGSLVTSTSGTITYTADLFSIITFPTTSGSFIFQPYTPSLNMEIGYAAPAGTWNLTSADLTSVTTGHASTTLGRSNGSHTITVGNGLGAQSILNDLLLLGDHIIIADPVVVAAGNNMTLNIGQISNGSLDFNKAITVSAGGVLSVNGGDFDDSIILKDGIGILGPLNGGSGINLLDYSDYTTNVVINIATGSATNITGGFSHIQSFIGGTGINNSLTADNSTNTWTITGSNQGTLNTGTFAAFHNIYGGSDNDTFTFSVGGIVTGTVDGGGGINTLKGPNENTLWTISSFGTGTLIPTTAASTSFTNIHYAVGGSSNDIFRFADSATFYFIDGGGNTPEINTLDYSLYTTPVMINIINHTATNLLLGFAHIQFFIGNFTLDPTIFPIINDAILKLYLALSILNQPSRFLSYFIPLDLFLYQKYDLKDYALIRNLQTNHKKILHPLLLQEQEVNTNVFEMQLTPPLPISFNHLIPINFFLYNLHTKDFDPVYKDFDFIY